MLAMWSLQQVAIRSLIDKEISLTLGRYQMVRNELIVADTIEFTDFMLAKDAVVFHAGTKINNGNIVTAGGRVLGVAAFRSTLKDAVDAAYEGVSSIKFPNMYFRRDIASR
jgi:phosphoribosylamine-glycine ligase